MRARHWLASLGSVAVALAILGMPLGAGANGSARIAIIIDDLGQDPHAGRRVVGLAGPVACAFLPHRPYVRLLAQEARARGKEVLLHLPLQSAEGRRLGPGGITLDSTEKEFGRIFRSALASVPGAVGVNTHMGSLITRHPGHMQWLMDALAERPELFFVDSYTTPRSVALQLARENGVPATRRDVFLDHERSRSSIAAEFQRLITLARRRGYAVAIGHPYPETLAFLEEALPRLDEVGVELVALRSLIGEISAGDLRSWPRRSRVAPGDDGANPPSGFAQAQ